MFHLSMYLKKPITLTVEKSWPLNFELLVVNFSHAYCKRNIL